MPEDSMTRLRAKRIVGPLVFKAIQAGAGSANGNPVGAWASVDNRRWLGEVPSGECVNDGDLDGDVLAACLDGHR